MNGTRVVVMLLFLFSSFSSLRGQSTDTVFGRSPNYYYYSWYDECPNYENDTNDFVSRHFLSIANNENHVFVGEQYAPGLMTIKGVAVMVAIELEHGATLDQYMPPADSLKTPEYVYVYQGMGPTPGVSSFYYPRQMMLLDSVRWDTAAPRVMALPTSARAAAMCDTSRTLYCHVYEAFFDTPVTVTDTFYFAGTYRSNVLHCHDDTVYDGSNIYVTPTCDRFSHYPTEYVVVMDQFSYECNKCRPEGRLFWGYLPMQEEVMESYCWLWLVSGPFIPITEVTGQENK